MGPLPSKGAQRPPALGKPSMDGSGGELRGRERTCSLRWWASPCPRCSSVLPVDPAHPLGFLLPSLQGIGDGGAVFGVPHPLPGSHEAASSSSWGQPWTPSFLLYPNCEAFGMGQKWEGFFFLCPSPTLASGSCLDWGGLGMLQSFSKTGSKMAFPDLEGGGCFRWYHRAPAPCPSSGVGAGSPPWHWGGLSEGLLQLFLGPAYPCTSVLCDPPASISPQFIRLISVSNVSSQKSLFFNAFCLQFIINHHFF